MEGKEIENLLNKYCEGTATPAEKALLESWYLSLDSEAIAELSPQEFAEDLLIVGERLPLQPTVRKLTWWRPVAAAAAVLALFIAAYFEWPAIQNTLHSGAIAALQVPANQQKQLTLADGSSVWVNAGSVLKYPQNFTGNKREVFLSGEAYFDIKHDPSKPFIIHTGNVITTVLGTAFNIKEDKIHHTVQVTVTRGKVSVANGGKMLGVITPNQQISFNTEDKRSVQQTVDATQVIAWQKTDLQFEDVTFAEAAKRMEDRYNVKISFANDKIKNCRFTGASHTGDKLEKVLKTICDFNNATYQTQPDGSIVINGPGCNN